MASKSKQVRAQQGKKDKRLGYWLIAIPVITFLIKLIIMSNTTGGGWLGADGENYLGGVDGILKDGLFSKEHLLGYWPAGYPILIWLMTKISLTHILWVISIVQSAFYGFASYYFVQQLRNTRVKPYLFTISVILAANPTLSLSSLAVGYESPIAACMLMITGLIIKSQLNPIDRKFWLRALAVGGFFALASFMQPRWVLTTIVVAVIWALFHKNRKHQALILAAVVGVMALAPAALIARNQKAGNGSVVSTNINAAFAYGTGPTTSGGYGRTGDYISCGDQKLNQVSSSSKVLTCVTKWYLTNPGKTLKLSWNKSVYFWSPWYGPEANGTMARNPWLKVNPLVNIGTKSQQGHDLVYGLVGKIFSWVFILLSIGLLFTGFYGLRKLGGVEAQLGYLLGVPVLTSWIVAIATLGDHRFRIPTMSLSLVLQVYGFLFISKIRRAK